MGVAEEVATRMSVSQVDHTTAARPHHSFRLVRAIVFVVCAAWLGVAMSLTPSESGYGTAEAFSPACGFLTTTGYPCPSCGMTTSMAATVRGRLGLAWRAQPFGIVLTFFVAFVGVVSLVECVIGREWFPRPVWLRWWWYVVFFLIGTSLGWIYVLWAGVNSGLWPIT